MLWRRFNHRKWWRFITEPSAFWTILQTICTSTNFREFVNSNLICKMDYKTVIFMRYKGKLGNLWPSPIWDDGKLDITWQCKFMRGISMCVWVMNIKDTTSSLTLLHFVHKCMPNCTFLSRMGVSNRLQPPKNVPVLTWLSTRCAWSIWPWPSRSSQSMVYRTADSIDMSLGWQTHTCIQQSEEKYINFQLFTLKISILHNQLIELLDVMQHLLPLK